MAAGLDRNDSEPEFAALVARLRAQAHLTGVTINMHGRCKIPHPAPAKEANWKPGRKRWTRLRAGCLDAFTYASVTAYLARYPGQRVAVALEQKRGALLYTLMKYEQVVLYPIHGATASKFRAALYPSGSKDDPKDAELLLDLLTQHRDHIRRLDPDTQETRKLQLLVEKRRKLVRVKHGSRSMNGHGKATASQTN